MRTFSTRTKFVAGATVAVFAVGGATAGYAYFSGTGNGTAAATISPGVTNQLSFISSTTTAIFPGDTAQTISGTVNNLSAQKVYVSSVRAYVTVDGSPAGCTSADVLLGGVAGTSTGTLATATYTAIELTKYDTTVTTDSANFSISLQFNDTTALQDGCKSAALTIHYVAS